MTMLDDVERTFNREFSGPRTSDLDELERLVDRGPPDDDPVDDPGDFEPDPDAEPPDLFDDVDDVGRDD